MEGGTRTEKCELTSYCRHADGGKSLLAETHPDNFGVTPLGDVDGRTRPSRRWRDGLGALTRVENAHG